MQILNIGTPQITLLEKSNVVLKKDNISLDSNITSKKPYYSPVSFKSASLKYLSAKKYLTDELLSRMKKGIAEKFPDLFSFDLKRLEGIQEGIKVFKGMTMKEIAFLLTTVSEFAVLRGCFNNCLHCYAEAKPPIKDDADYTSRMSWEDFLSLTEGINTLNERLGFFASACVSKNSQRYIAPFYDGDAINTAIIDKFGREHDFIEITEKLNESMGIKSIFDTAGWNLNDKKSQKKAEKYAKYYSDPENMALIDQFNVSFNTFHSLHAKEVELRKANNHKLADKLRDIYTSRMANVLYTFTPLHKTEEFGLIMASLPNEEEFEGFTEKDLQELFDETLLKLKGLYLEDLNSEQVFVKSKKEVASRINTVKKSQRPLRIITMTDKIKKKFSEKSELAKDNKKVLDATKKFIRKQDLDIVDYRENFVGMIDANGKYYMTNYKATFPTELQLNFVNRKNTPQIKPELQQDAVLSRVDINNLRIKDGI